MLDHAHTPALRIGQVAQQTGVAVATLRAWQSRYGLAAPARTEGGQRLYSQADVERIRAVTALVAQGWAVSAAVQQVLGTAAPMVRHDERANGPNDVQRAHGAASHGESAWPGAARRLLLQSLADVDGFAVLAAYETARTMLHASSPAGVRDAVITLVERLGGQVAPATEQDDVVIPLDLSFGEGQPLLPRAEPGSVARMRLEAVLPLVVEDARTSVHRLQLLRRAGAGAT